MNKVLFSSWAGKVVDNRGKDSPAPIELSEIPLQHDGKQIKAFMSWNGFVVTDDKVNVLDLARAYLTEVQKLSCGECTVGYLGVNILRDTMDKIASGQGTASDVDLLRWLASGIRHNTKCDFCALAVTPIVQTLEYYSEEYTRLITAKKPLSKTPYVSQVTAPCMEACPAHQDAPGYIELVRNRRYPEALELIRQSNCFPGATGRACVAFCEANCVRGDVDSPIAIRALKRVPADDEITASSKPGFRKKRAKQTKVAVIGAGPAGLAASYNLALLGYKVTVFDEQASGGGMALVGIPAYRLPKDNLGREVDIIKDLGVEIKWNTRVGKDITLEQLSGQGFKAAFIATGAHMGRELGLEVEDGGGVVDGTRLLYDVNTGKKVAVKDRVVVVGGGNVAIDCARTCLRLGFKEVTIVYRRSRNEMPARKDEVEAAEQEGVKILFLANPAKVLTKNGRVTGAECIKMALGEPDASGRRRPVPVKGSEFVIETDMIIPAIGEKPDLSFLGKDLANIADREAIKVTPGTYQTSVPWVFAGGDCVTGPATLIEAIAAGNRAARNIDQYLQSGKVTASDEDELAGWLHEVAMVRRRDGNVVAKEARRAPGQLPLPDRKGNFNEVEQCFTTEAATSEADRCLRCYRVMVAAIE